MRKIILVLCVSILISVFLTAAAVSAQRKLEYPKSKKVNQVDNYHGTKVTDPFRWLENPSSEDSKAWIEDQNKLTFSYLSEIPEREKIKKRLTKLWNYEKYSAPFKKGKRYFYYKNDGLQNQPVLYFANFVTEKGRVLLDPNKFSKDGTTSLAGLSISEDGNIAAYGISKGGSDWREWRFFDISTGEQLPDVLKNIKFSSVSWTKDGKGVFYSRYPAPNEKTKLEESNFNQKLYYHQLGTKQSEDKLIYQRPDNKRLGIGGVVTEDGKWLIIYLRQGTSRNNQVYFKNLQMNDAPILPLIDKSENNYSFIGNIGQVFYFRTNKDAPLGRVVSVDVLVGKRVWREMIPQAKETLRRVSFVNNMLVANCPY